MKQVYQTKDGQTFETEEAAERHETELYEQWLASQMILSSFIGSLDDDDGQDWHGWSDRRIVNSYLRKFWEGNMPGRTVTRSVAKEGFRITGDAILNHLKANGLPVPDSAVLVFEVPRGGDYSGMELELNPEVMIVRSK